MFTWFVSAVSVVRSSGLQVQSADGKELPIPQVCTSPLVIVQAYCVIKSHRPLARNKGLALFIACGTCKGMIVFNN